MDRLRIFIRADNRSTVDVGHLREGTRPLHVQKPQHARAETGTLGPEPLWTGLGRQLGARLLQSKEATTCSSAEKDWNVACMRSGQHGHVSCGEATTKRRPT